MRKVAVLMCVVYGSLASTASARYYVPLGELGGISVVEALQVERPTGEPVGRMVKAADRPRIAGARPVEVQLLTDALRRKQPFTVGDSTEKAYESIVRNALRDPVKRSHIRGMLAEARFLYENPAWGYVRSPTASQHDIYRWEPGRNTPFTAQIKTHSSADPAAYARKMRVDFRSDLFLVPEDHVNGLREYWRQQATQFQGQGLRYESNEAWRQLNRVRGLRFTNLDLDNDLTRASQYVLRQQGRTYVSLGAGRALVLNADGTELFRTGTVGYRAPSRTAARGGHIAAERLRTISLADVGSRYAHLAWRGIAGFGIALVVWDTAQFLRSFGDMNTALNSPIFYTRMSGTISGLALGAYVGGKVASYVVTTTAPMIGGWSVLMGGTAGLVTATVVGVGGYFGGEAAARLILEWVNPEFLHQGEAAAIRDARNVIEARLRGAQVM